MYRGKHAENTCVRDFFCFKIQKIFEYHQRKQIQINGLWIKTIGSRRSQSLELEI